MAETLSDDSLNYLEPAPACIETTLTEGLRDGHVKPDPILAWVICMEHLSCPGAQFTGANLIFRKQY